MLLGLLAIALIAALALVLFDGDDDRGEGAGTTQSTTEQSGAAQQPSAGGNADEQAGASGGDPAGAAGSLTASGTSILPPPAGGLGDFVGQNATGDAVVVQSVVRNAEENDTLEGFWVGSSEQERVYVERGGTVAAEPPRQTYPRRWTPTSADEACEWAYGDLSDRAGYGLPREDDMSRMPPCRPV